MFDIIDRTTERGDVYRTAKHCHIRLQCCGTSWCSSPTKFRPLHTNVLFDCDQFRLRIPPTCAGLARQQMTWQAIIIKFHSLLPGGVASCHILSTVETVCMRMHVRLGFQSLLFCSHQSSPAAPAYMLYQPSNNSLPNSHLLRRCRTACLYRSH
jgi:hypothetical protein